jgi:hypothetical protein
MRKKLQQSYTCLTLFKQDIRELVLLFQTHLQNVEIVIDSNRILDIAQLEQFDPAYQVQSLIARGYYHETLKEHAKCQGEPPLIELRMSKVVALLIVWKEAGEAEPEMLADIRELLLRHLNRFHQLLIFCASFSTLLSGISPLQSVAHQHHLDFLAQLLLEAGGGTLLGLATFFLFIAIVHLLKLDTRVFLFPGMTKATQIYGRRDVIGTIVVVLIFLVLVEIIVTLAFRILWR